MIIIQCRWVAPMDISSFISNYWTNNYYQTMPRWWWGDEWRTDVQCHRCSFIMTGNATQSRAVESWRCFQPFHPFSVAVTTLPPFPLISLSFPFRSDQLFFRHNNTNPSSFAVPFYVSVPSSLPTPQSFPTIKIECTQRLSIPLRSCHELIFDAGRPSIASSSWIMWGMKLGMSADSRRQVWGIASSDLIS